MNVRLPDGSQIDVPQGATVLQVAEKIGARLAKAAIAGRVNGDLVDVTAAVPDGAAVEIITSKSPGALTILRHSASHVLAAAVKNLYGPNVKFAIGPAIDAGFYYDFDLDYRFVPEDLAKIEAEMGKVVAAGTPFERFTAERRKAIEDSRREGQQYKAELMEDIPDAEVSFYRLGGFTDLCRGPHVPNSAALPAFKLTSIAGSYWRGDSKNKMLQRIYGTAFFSKKELDDYLNFLEEAKRRDHRRIGRELDLFSFHDEGPGFPFFHPRGMVVLNEILNYWRLVHRREGYLETRTPIILSESLWHQSGHWDHYKQNMYFTKIDDQDFAVKPMNCPGNILIYKTGQHSYRDFPIRMGELGLVHRHELSGVLHGLMRVRSFTQDDAHIFCLPEQINEEVGRVIGLCFEVYAKFGLTDVHVELSTRPENSMGSDELWERATNSLMEALATAGVEYKVNPGDGAFYGPKIDFHIKDAIGRTWQCGTIQLDFSMPERFDLEYTAADGSKARPVMIHRVVLGSLERFLGILLEHYAGALPFWLAPTQAAVIPITDAVGEYAVEVRNAVAAAGYRVELDSRNETVGNKIRQAEVMKVPYMLVVGQREAQNGTVSIREHTKGDMGAVKMAEVIGKFDVLAGKKG